MHPGQGEIKCYSSNHQYHVCDLHVHLRLQNNKNESEHARQPEGKQGKTLTNLTYENHEIHILTFTS